VAARLVVQAGGWWCRPAAGSYDVDAAFMSLYVHEGGIHAL